MQFHSLAHWQGNGESSTNPRLAFRKNISVVLFNYLFADWQANAGAFKLVLTMQSFEKRKNVIHIFLLEADTIILYMYITVVLVVELGIDAGYVKTLDPFRIDAYLRCYIFLAKLEGIDNKVLK